MFFCCTTPCLFGRVSSSKTIGSISTCLRDESREHSVSKCFGEPTKGQGIDSPRQNVSWLLFISWHEAILRACVKTRASWCGDEGYFIFWHFIHNTWYAYYYYGEVITVKDKCFMFHWTLQNVCWELKQRTMSDLCYFTIMSGSNILILCIIKFTTFFTHWIFILE